MKINIKRKSRSFVNGAIRLAKGGGVGDRISLEEFNEPLANSNAVVNENVAKQSAIKKGSVGTQQNPVGLKEVEITTRRTKPLGWTGQVANAEKTNPALQTSSAGIAKALFVDPITKALSIPSNVVAKGIQSVKNMDWESKSGHKLDSIQGIQPKIQIKDTTGFFDNTPMNALGVKRDEWKRGFYGPNGEWDSIPNNDIGLQDVGIMAGNVAMDPLSYTPFMLAKLHREKALSSLDNLTTQGENLAEKEGRVLVKHDPVTGESTWAPKPNADKTARVVNADLYFTAQDHAAEEATKFAGKNYQNLKYMKENILQSEGSIKWQAKYQDIFNQYKVNSNDFQILVEDPEKYSRFISTPNGAAFINALTNRKQQEESSPAMKSILQSVNAPQIQLKKQDQSTERKEQPIKLQRKEATLLNSRNTSLEPELTKFPQQDNTQFQKVFTRKRQQGEIGNTDKYKYDRMGKPIQKLASGGSIKLKR